MDAFLLLLYDYCKSFAHRCQIICTSLEKLQTIPKREQVPVASTWCLVHVLVRIRCDFSSTNEWILRFATIVHRSVTIFFDRPISHSTSPTGIGYSSFFVPLIYQNTTVSYSPNPNTTCTCTGRIFFFVLHVEQHSRVPRTCTTLADKRANTTVVLQ